MSPLRPDRLSDLRDVARALDGERRAPFGGRPAARGATLRRVLLLAMLAVAVPTAWRVSTPCGLRPCAPPVDQTPTRRELEAPATIAVAQAPREEAAAVVREEFRATPREEPPPVVRAAPRAEAAVVREEPPTVPVEETRPPTDAVPRVPSTSVAALVANEREAGPPPVAPTRPASQPAPATGNASAARKPTHAAPIRAAAPPVPAAEPERAPTILAAREIVPATPRAVQPTPEAAAAAPPNLSGRWLVTNAIDATDYTAFSGLRIRFRIHLVQRGESVSGYGEKFTVNDEPLPESQRNPIELAGTVRGRDVLVRFLERGARRVSSGGFRWRVSPDGRTLQGTFDSTAAGTHGRSHASREG